MLKLSQELFSAADPDINRSGSEVSLTGATTTLKSTIDDFEIYFDQVCDKFRKEPAGVVNSLIANARINGEYLTRRQMMGYYILTSAAGHDTTANTTSAAMWVLAERPDLQQKLRSDPTLIRRFVEESIRWSTPVKHFMRTAIKDVELGGQKIRKDDWIMMSFHSANRDEDAFENPYEFDINRDRNRQIAFGHGPHVCLGQHLARFEMAILWEELLKRVKSVELAGTPSRTISNFVCGPKTVPVHFQAA